MVADLGREFQLLHHKIGKMRSSGCHRTLTVVDLADKPGPSAPKIIAKCMVSNTRSLAKPGAA